MVHILEKLKSSVRNRAEYRRIVAEISALSPREADDLGLRPSDARRIAGRAVYGA